jgi:O-antigen biosynthesis protein
MDYCLNLRARGLRIVYDPDLFMFHFESSSRDTDVADWEKMRLLNRWAPLTMADPYSNPNLSTGIPRITSTVNWARRRRPKLRRPRSARA